MAYINLNDIVEFHALVEFDLQCSAIGLKRLKKLPLRRLAVDFDPTNVQMIGVENDILGLSIRYGLEAMNDISGQLLLIK